MALSCTNTATCTCGCCAGTSIETPVIEQNLPGLSAIAYRAGTWGTFRESMLARLSSADYPALRYLKTRNTDDFSIALLDASAVVFDILTFYQERLANESYLRTATQLRSLTELARLIGYQPAPGVAGETYLAFTLKAATGLPANPGTTAITIPTGTQVQSVPAQNQTAQSFETSADILAKADWNALPIAAGIPWTPPGGSGLYLTGTTTQLNPGDSLLLLGTARENWTPGATPNEQWDVVVLNKVVADTQNNITWVGWDRRLSHGSGSGSSPSTGWTTAKVFAFRQKAALFGATAPDPNLFVNAKKNTQTSLPALIDTTPPSWTWKNYSIISSDQIDLDSTYPKIVVGSWFALVLDGLAQLYKTKAATATSRAAFATSARITELSADYADPDITAFPLQGTSVLAQSEQLTVARQPIDHPLYGTVIDIDALRPDLVGAQAVAVFGKAQKLAVAPTSSRLTFQPDDTSPSLTLNPGDIVTLISPGPLPANGDGSVPDWSGASGTPALRVADASGRTGTANAALASFTLAAASKTDPDIQEFALVSSVLANATPYPHTQINLKYPLGQVYDRTLSTVNANVGLATAGRSVSEVMGNGAAATPNQRFTLKQSPLTFTQSATPTGRASTLQVTANSVKWKEVPTLYQQRPSASVFATLNNTDATTAVLFGDGVEGATLPTGQNNIQANLPCRRGCRQQCRGRLNHHNGRSPAGRQRGDQPVRRHRRPGPAIHHRCPQQRAILGANAGPSGVDCGLSEFCGRLCWDRQGRCPVDTIGSGARRLSDRRRRGWRGLAAGQPHARQSARVAAGVWQPLRAHQSGQLPGNAVPSQRQRRLRSGLRFRHRAGRHRRHTAHPVLFRQSQLRPGRHRRRNSRLDPGCARRRRRQRHRPDPRLHQQGRRPREWRLVGLRLPPMAGANRARHPARPERPDAHLSPHPRRRHRRR